MIFSVYCLSPCYYRLHCGCVHDRAQALSRGGLFWMHAPASPSTYAAPPLSLLVLLLLLLLCVSLDLSSKRLSTNCMSPSSDMA